jgi:hypothetical protein
MKYAKPIAPKNREMEFPSAICVQYITACLPKNKPIRHRNSSQQGRFEQGPLIVYGNKDRKERGKEDCFVVVDKKRSTRSVLLLQLPPFD